MQSFVNKKVIFSLSLLILVLGAISYSEAASYNQAPMLQELVDKDQLPDVEQRLPQNPLVIETQHEIGEYGGTWRRSSTSESWDFVRVTMYGHSLIRYVDDALHIAPNLLESWEANEDYTTWTLNIREGVRWSDGVRFNTDDIIFWWEDMVLNDGHPDSVVPMTNVGGEPMRLEKIDDFTLRAHFAGPNISFAEFLALWPNAGIGPRMIVPSHYLKDYHPDYSDYDNFDTFQQKEEWWMNIETPVLTAWKPVEQLTGERLVMERNPYYYAVDEEGNQLPYIDRVVVDYVEDIEVIKLKAMRGELDMQVRPYLDLSDLAMLRDNEDDYGFEVILWGGGSGSGPMYSPNRNHRDPAKRDLYKKPEFLRALSHAINRSRIQTMVYYNTGYPTTGTFSPNTPHIHRTEEVKEAWEKWRDLGVEYLPEKSMELLDQIGVVDLDNDGWRNLPNGEELVLRIDLPASDATTELVKEDWEAIGLKTIINPTPSTQLAVMHRKGETDVRGGWEMGGVPSTLLRPHWLVPIYNERYAPLYGSWYHAELESKADTEADVDPWERTPPRKKPPEGSPVDQLQKTYNRMLESSSAEEVEMLVAEIINIYVEHGPFYIGTVANTPRLVIVSDRMKNVPRGEELRLGGWVNPWVFVQPGMMNPCQFYIAD